MTLVHPVSLSANTEGITVGAHETKLGRALRCSCEDVNVRNFSQHVDGLGGLDIRLVRSRRREIRGRYSSIFMDVFYTKRGEGPKGVGYVAVRRT